jgi:hypothetical protein
MTAALATPLAPRPVSWNRLGWVIWRSYRTTLIAILAVLALLSLYLYVTGHKVRTAWASVEACHPARSATCGFQWNNFHDTYGQIGFISTVLILLPGLVGVFAGAPLLARELETGTFRYAWTQGVGRMRWAIALIVPAAIGVAAVMVAFGAVATWHHQPLFASGILHRLEPGAFSVTGLAVAGWTLLGFALGVLAGLLWRRVVPAIATAFAAWFGIAYAAVPLRKHYEAPLTTTRMQLSSRDEAITQWWDKGGVRASDAQVNHVLAAIGVQFHTGGGGKITAHPGASSIDPVQYLLQHGFRMVTQYQPDSRYWPFQWIEFAWLLALSVALIGTALLLLRRRSA